jgi:hypothetical protein
MIPLADKAQEPRTHQNSSKHKDIGFEALSKKEAQIAQCLDWNLHTATYYHFLQNLFLQGVIFTNEVADKQRQLKVLEKLKKQISELSNILIDDYEHF